MLLNELEFCRKVLSASDALPYHAYSRSSGVNKEKRTVACRRVVVDASYNLSIDPGPYMDQNVLTDAYSLMYRKCPSDTSKGRFYFFGDICITVDSKTKALKGLDFESFSANMRTAFPDGATVPDYLLKFKTAVSNGAFISNLWNFLNAEVANLLSDKKILKGEGLDKLYSIFVHFDLTQPLGVTVTHWHQMPDCVSTLDGYALQLIKDDTFVYEESVDKYALKKSLLHMLTSGDDKSDNQFVGFNLKDRYKSFALSEKDFRLLFYYLGIIRALGVASKDSQPFAIRVIPSGSFSGKDAVNFLEHLRDLQKKKSGGQEAGDVLESAEGEIQDTSDDTLDDPKSFLDPVDVVSDVVASSAASMVAFDVLITKEDGKVPQNVSEINNVHRSQLLRNLKCISEAGATVQTTLKAPYKPSLFKSFYNIHRTVKKGEKYQGKLMKFMTRVLMGTYYGDPDLSRIFVDRVLGAIRKGNGDKECRGLNISYRYLKSLENERGSMTDEKIAKQTSDCEQLGRLCAKVAWPLSYVIKPFEKSLVGYLKQRAGSLTQVGALVSEHMGRLSLHKGETAGNIKIDTDNSSQYSHEAVKVLKTLDTEGVKLNQDAFVIGFVDQFYLERYLHRPQQK